MKDEASVPDSSFILHPSSFILHPFGSGSAMLIEVKCLCGYRVKVEDERAGERFPCATCWRTILIEVMCRCGKTLRAPPQMIGQSIQCPLCTRMVIVPDPTVRESAAAPLPVPMATDVPPPPPPPPSARDHLYWVLLLALTPLFL